MPRPPRLIQNISVGARALSENTSPIAGVLRLSLLISMVLAAHLAYYVTIVQFAWVRRLLDAGWTMADLGAPLGAFAATGLIASIATGIALDRAEPTPGRWFGAIALVALAVVAVGHAGLRVADRATIAAAFVALGALLGIQIVLLLGAFCRHIHARLRGIFAGAAAGAAYLAANLMAGYAGSPDRVGAVGGVLLALSAAAIAFAGPKGGAAQSFPFGDDEVSPARSALAFVPMALLVAVDTFTFYPLAQPDPRPIAVFATGGDWLENGIWHFLFAGIAGLLYARNGARRLTLAASAFLLIVTALLWLGAGHDIAKAVRGFYSAVVGIYTVGFIAAFAEFAPEHGRYRSLGFGMALCGWIANPAGVAAWMALSGFLPASRVSMIAFFAALAVAAAALAAVFADERNGLVGFPRTSSESD